ncbi:crAss001_48 related protein [Leisingera caerulea]|uniref:crAss001_48 related protein n=1 Tax=Leisingera caerulea TaxID=506591 RepID=UPI0003F5BE8A|nr:hypothetical protein [Leisingera caerulea]
MALQPHEERMIEEATELGIKVRNLGSFLEGEEFKSLDATDQRLLTQQHGHMISYFSTLQKRINRISTKA